MTVLAHDVAGSGLPPAWLLGYGIAVLLVLTALARRGAPPALAPERDDDGADDLVPPSRRPGALAAAAVGLVGWGVLVASGLLGVDSSASNVAPYLLYAGVLLLVPAVALLLGDIWRSANPLASLARIVGAARGGLPLTTGRTPPAWTAAAGLAALAWLRICYHAADSPRMIGLAMAGGTVAAVAAAQVWGLAWLRRGEGLAAFLALFGSVAPVGRDADGRWHARRPALGALAPDSPARGPGALALVAVALGALAYDGLEDLRWWRRELFAERGPWLITLIGTIGLGLCIAVVAAVWLAATRAADRRLDGLGVPDGEVDLPAWSPAPLVPLLAGGTVALYAAAAVIDAYNLLALLSDPLGRGWDLFGTIDLEPRTSLLLSPWIAWIEVAGIALGGVGAVVLAQQEALRVAPTRRAAAAAAVPLQAAIVVLTVALVSLLLGA